MIYPNGKRIFLKEEKVQEEVTTSGIVLGGSVDGDSSSKTKKCIVKFVGDEVTKFKPDDLVIIKNYATDEFTIKGEVYLITDESSIICKI